jgi:hypothetical protein
MFYNFEEFIMQEFRMQECRNAKCRDNAKCLTRLFFCKNRKNVEL